MGRTTAFFVGLAVLAASPGLAAADDGFSRPGAYVGVGGVAAVDLFSQIFSDVVGELGLDADVKDSGGINARAGYRVNSWFAAEFMYEWIDEFKIDIEGLGAGLTTHSFVINPKFVLPKWRAQPYLLLGFGAQRSIFTDDSGILGDQKSWAFLGRPAAGVDVYITENWLANVEVAGLLSVNELEWAGTDVNDIFYLSVGAGVQYRF